MFCLIASFQVGMASSPEPAGMDFLAEQSAASSSLANLTLLYPSTSMATYNKSQALCGLVTSGLGLSPLVPFADNPHNISNYSRGDDRKREHTFPSILV